MANDLIVSGPFGFKNWPQCIKCGKPVDEVSYHHELELVNSMEIGFHYAYIGETYHDNQMPR